MGLGAEFPLLQKLQGALRAPEEACARNLSIKPCRTVDQFLSTAWLAGLMTASIKVGSPKRELTEILVREQVPFSLCPPCRHNDD